MQLRRSSSTRLTLVYKSPALHMLSGLSGSGTALRIFAQTSTNLQTWSETTSTPGTESWSADLNISPGSRGWLRLKVGP